jgi:hypothetical protein
LGKTFFQISHIHEIIAFERLHIRSPGSLGGYVTIILIYPLINALYVIDLKPILLARRSMCIILSDLYLFIIPMFWIQRLRKRHRSIGMALGQS